MSELKKPPVLQLRHNNSEGFVYAYEADEMDKYLSKLDGMITDLEESHEKEIGRLRAELEYSTFKPNFAKVIADKDAKILALDAEVFKQKRHAELFLGERNYAETQLRHQKFKRCLAMARWCDTKADWYYGIGRSLRSRVDFYIKWRDKWLKIAGKFKEVK